MFKRKYSSETDKNSETQPTSAFRKQLEIVRKIKHNQQGSEFGLERIIRLFLSAAQLITPVMLLKSYFGRLGFLQRKLAVELYLLFKIVFPLTCILFEWLNTATLLVNSFFLVETLLYLLNLVFLSDLVKPHSYRRALLFTFLNYIEICFGFAAIYSHLNLSNNFNTLRPFQTKMEAVYFSFITASSIGYGDFWPNTGVAEFLVVCQSLIYFLFIAIFMGFFVSKV